MTKKIRSLAMMALAFGAMAENNHHQPISSSGPTPDPIYKRKKCKSCKLFSKSTHNCQSENWKRYITAKSNACEQYKPKKKK